MDKLVGPFSFLFPLSIKFILGISTDDKVLVYDLGRPEDAQEVLQLYRDHFVADAPFRQIFFWEESEVNRTSARNEADLVAAQPSTTTRISYLAYI